MNTVLHSFLKWVKDPFGKNEITKHNTVIQDIHTAEYITKKTQTSIKRRRRHQRVYGGTNMIDRSVLGTHRRVRKEV